jgi:hypothetical protein
VSGLAELADSPQTCTIDGQTNRPALSHRRPDQRRPPVSLYLVPPSDLARTRPIIRLMLNQFGRHLTESMQVGAMPSYEHRLCFCSTNSRRSEGLLSLESRRKRTGDRAAPATPAEVNQLPEDDGILLVGGLLRIGRERCAISWTRDSRDAMDCRLPTAARTRRRSSLCKRQRLGRICRTTVSERAGHRRSVPPRADAEANSPRRKCRVRPPPPRTIGSALVRCSR